MYRILNFLHYHIWLTRRMSKGNDNFQTHGIYNRLITFVVDRLIVQGQKKVTLGEGGGGAAAMPVHESIEVPIIGSSRNVKIIPSNTSIGGINGVLNNEVVIDFRHIEKEEESPAENSISTSTSFRKLSSQINFPNYKNGFILKAADRIPVEEHGKERGGRGGGRSQHSADQSKKEESEDHSREKNTAAVTATTTTSGSESEDAMRKHNSRSRASRPPLKSVASNINEKADAFIRSRKEVMKKNFGYGS